MELCSNSNQRMNELVALGKFLFNVIAVFFIYMLYELGSKYGDKVLRFEPPPPPFGQKFIIYLYTILVKGVWGIYCKIFVFQTV